MLKFVCGREGNSELLQYCMKFHYHHHLLKGRAEKRFALQKWDPF